MQDDILFSYMTVREALLFAANLKLNKSGPEKTQIVNKLLDLLKLSGVQDL